MAERLVMTSVTAISFRTTMKLEIVEEDSRVDVPHLVVHEVGVQHSYYTPRRGERRRDFVD